MRKNVYFLVLFSNAIVSILCIVLASDLGIIYYFISISLFFIILIHNKNNIIFFIRNLILGAVGYLAYTAKLIDPSALYSYHLHSSQTYEIAWLMFLLTNIALVGSEVGFAVGKKIKVTKKSFPKVIESKTLFYITSIFLIISALIFFKTLAGFGEYGQEKYVAAAIGNLNSIINILFFILIFLYYKSKNFIKKDPIRKNTMIFLFIFVYIYIELLHGVRLSALNGMIGVYVLYRVYTNQSLTLKIKYIVPILILYALLQFIGKIRSGYDRIGSVTISNLFFSPSSESGMALYQGTINDIAATFSGTIMLLQKNLVDFQYGKTYFEFLLRTPPAFIYPDRPEGFALKFEKLGFTSGGGFFELAEAYLNFGALGAFIVPFSISLIISYAYKQFTTNMYSLKHSILFFSIIASYIRGLMYQNFVLYKSILTGFIIYLSLYVIYSIIKTYRR